MTLINQSVQNTAQTIIRSLNRIFCEVFDDDELVVSEVTTAQDVDGWDSLANIRIMVSVEKAFNIRFTAAEILGLSNVGALAELVMVKLTRA